MTSTSRRINERAAEASREAARPPGARMSGAIRQLYAVRETDPNPFAIIPPALVVVPMPNRENTDAVYRGRIDAETLLGWVRKDLETGDVVARTRGNAENAADVRRFSKQSEALDWLTTAIDGVIPRKPSQRRAP
jgi:hypothetical protein